MDTIPTEHPIDFAHPLQTVEADGCTFSYRENGDGPAMVVLHGIGSGSGSWVYQLDGLADRYRVIAWDAPGYANTTPVDTPSPVAAQYAEKLETLLSALNVVPAVLIGHSFGALTAASYASRHSELPALILADPANGYGAVDEETRAGKRDPRIAAMRELGPVGLAEKRSSALLSDNVSADARGIVQWNMSKLNSTGYVQAAHVLANSHLIGDAPAYNGPVLVMCGSEDTVTPEEVCRPVANAYSNSEYLTLPRVGHASYVENGTQFNQAILNFIEMQND
ncbi:MAG: alpha/beta hydrolase [Rhodospirillaceae bacterium]|nr:alpha/beta hydrolase [Rhodospirillaceae bacterium]|tara:strand:+ start:28809 stop:29648 length:840 start_codon:yes stop_codon:yes gene_type:complete